MARYETFAALERIIETGNAHCFHRKPIKANARFLRDQFKGGEDEFIRTDPVLSTLNPKRIQYLALGACLAVGGDATMLDEFCSI
jgi:hypothetical protein